MHKTSLDLYLVCNFPICCVFFPKYTFIHAIVYSVQTARLMDFFSVIVSSVIYTVALEYSCTVLTPAGITEMSCDCVMFVQ